MTLTIDELRHHLRTTEFELADTKRKLAVSEQHNATLKTENEDFQERMRKASSLLGVSSSWKVYDAPGACGFCGSLTCNRNCVK